eukprot:1256964-Rhodomonas_salina.1
MLAHRRPPSLPRHQPALSPSSFPARACSVQHACSQPTRARCLQLKSKPTLKAAKPVAKPAASVVHAPAKPAPKAAAKPVIKAGLATAVPPGEMQLSQVSAALLLRARAVLTQRLHKPATRIRATTRFPG